MSEAGEARLVAVDLDPQSLKPGGPFEGDRQVAIADLIADNRFAPVARPHGTFRLRLTLSEGKLIFDIADAEDGTAHMRHILSLSPLRQVIRDYFLICDAHRAAAGGPRGGTQMEAIDVGRRGLHNEGAEILKDRLAGHVAVDFPTARRLFTLVCALYWKG